MFHLSLPVRQFDACLAFYRDCFDAEVEMLGSGVANLFVFGGQLTLHDKDTLTDEVRREMHFGQVVTPEEWNQLRDRIAASGHSLLRAVAPSDALNRRGKLLMCDPSGNLVEINSKPITAEVMQLSAAALEGRHIRLEPVTPDMRDEMQSVLDCDPDAWAMQFTNGRGDGFPNYWTAMVRPSPAGSRIAFGVRLRSSGRLVGTTSFHHISPANRTVEIGSTFYLPEARGTAVNPEAKLLLLSHAFDRGALRVQLTVDSRNERSQAAVAKLGAAREGVLRRHLVTWTGHLRDSVVFSITATEWAAVRERLIDRAAQDRGVTTKAS
jgi:RimJ/RimL family protein N-acetyltransferase/extradiol dioxygenase family protein